MALLPTKEHSPVVMFLGCILSLFLKAGSFTRWGLPRFGAEKEERGKHRAFPISQVGMIPLMPQRGPFFLGPKGEQGERDFLQSTDESSAALRDIVCGKATFCDNVTWDW